MKNLSVKLTERFCNHSFKNSSLLGRRFNLMPNGTCCLWQFSVKLYHICRHTVKDFFKYQYFFLTTFDQLLVTFRPFTFL